MRFHAAPAQTANLTLDELVDRLSTHAVVDGVLLMGSTGTAAFGPASDYDLLLILNELPSPLRIVTTWIDERMTEVYCTTTSVIEPVVANANRWSDRSDEGTLLCWLRDGRIAFDREGRLARLQHEAHAAPSPAMPEWAEIYEAWRKIGYNVAHMRRYLADDDPVARAAVELRLLYSVAEVNGHYFTARRLPWRGEKSAVRYWMEHDPEYLALVAQYVATVDRERKVKLYVQLAEHALAPVGGVWKPGSTTVALGAPFGSGEARQAIGDESDALHLWQRLSGVEQPS